MNRTAIRIATLLAAVALSGAAVAQTMSFLSPAPLTDEGWMPRPAAKKASRLTIEPPAPAPAPVPVAAPAPPPPPAPEPAAAAAAPLPAVQERAQERAEPAGPTLKREVTVTGDIVRIGDLVDNAGAVAEVAIFRAPTPKEVEARLLRALAAQSSLANVNDLAVSFDGEMRMLHIEPNAELGI